MKLIEPRNLKGFRDYLPKDQIVRARMLEKIKLVFERFGFEPLETPVLEYEDVLAGKYGEEGEMLMYRFKDNGDRSVAMRYDLTVPLARVVAQYQNELPKPFKRYQIAPVWRAENTQRGRYREFYQCDADVVGAEVGIADAECIAAVEQILVGLGIKRFKIKISNRKILNAIMLTANVPKDKIVVAIRAIDKIDKIGAKAVAEELQKKIGMTLNEAEGLIRLASTKVPDVGALKTFINKYILKQPQGQEGFEELNKVFIALKEMGVKNIEIDEEHVTITYNQKTTHYYNAEEIRHREWIYKYNDDPEFVAAVARVIALARKHHKDLPETIACPPGCAECCSGYEPFVSRPDVERIASFLNLTPQEVLDEYIVQRKSADGYHLGWIRKVTEDTDDKCVFLKESRPGRYYCGIYSGRPDDCRDFTPIGCGDVNETLGFGKPIKIGAPFAPKQRRGAKSRTNGKSRHKR